MFVVTSRLLNMLDGQGGAGFLRTRTSVISSSLRGQAVSLCATAVSSAGHSTSTAREEELAARQKLGLAGSKYAHTST
jgi:hypothetical protein